MSSDQPSTQTTFEERLTAMYDRYRRRKLDNELEDLAEMMEETILQQELATSFFEAAIELDTEAKEEVAEAMDLLGREEYDSVEDRLDTLGERIRREETRVSNEIQTLRLDRLETVAAMRRLNERVERVNPTQLLALEELLENWDWKAQVYTESATTLAERRREAIDYGNDMTTIYEDLKEELFGPYRETELWPLVESLLDDERLSFGALSESERELLADSDLADYIELSLS